jgi:outer membrane murein-binding lipoprotein Lpp
MKKLFFISLIVSILFLLGCGGDKVNNINDFQTLVQKIDQKNQDINSKQNEIQDMIKKFNQNVPEGNRVNISFDDTTQGMNLKQKQLLEDMLKQEKDVSWAGLLKQIITKNDEIASLKDELFKISQKMPKPYDVKRGDNHYKVSFKYLTEVEKLGKEKADELIDKVRLIDELVPGFQVWLFYKDDVFGTFVTQGKAKISPNIFSLITRKQALEKAMVRGKQSVYDSLMQEQARIDSLKATQPVNPGK